MFEGGLEDETNWRSKEQLKPLPSRCGFGSGHGSGRTPLLISQQRFGSGPIPVLHTAGGAVAFAAAMAAVDRDEAHGSRFSEWLSSTRFRKRVANCNLNRSQSQACVESGNIHGRGNRLLLEVRIGKEFLLERRLVLNRK